MNVLFKVLTISALWLTACTSGGDRRAAILDSSTPLNQLKTTAEATVTQKGDLLWVTSAAKDNSGIQFDKAMDLSGYGEVVVEICNPTDNEVEFDIRFDGADANLQEEKDIFRKRVQVGRGKTESFSWPFNTLFLHPEAQELLKELKGIPPYKTWGYVAQLDPKKVISVSIYPAWKPYKPIEWGVKRLYVKKDRYSWPDWFAYPKEKLLPFIDKYGQFKFKEWPGKIHSDAELQQAKAEEAKDLARFTLASPASQLAKQEFRKDLQRKYATIARLNAQWKSDYKSWDDLLARTDVKPGEGANEDLMAFSIRIMDGYFGNVREVFKEVAPQKLYLGCRFAGGAPDRVIIEAAKYCDVISYNIYKRNLTDLRLPDAATDRPIMIGEFHCGSTDRGMFLAGLIDAGSQENKGVAYADYVRSCLLHPNIIGTHWHQYSDQATTGRFDGEALQVGFTDVCDTPYPEVIKCCREIGREMYTLRGGF